MEDRQPTGLLVEMLRGTDSAARALELDVAGMRVSLWAPDPYPAGLPQRIDDCDRLLIAESEDPNLEEAYRQAAPCAPTTTQVPLRRYPRPSQGICTGEGTTGLLLVLFSTKDVDGWHSLRDWADFVHLRWIAAARVPGYTTITPYQHVRGVTESPSFCHLYEMTTDDPRAAYESMTPRVAELLGGGPGNPGYDEWAWHPALRVEYVNTFRRLR